MSEQPLTVGTAGHIDHGKTALVRALTGVDTDRLPEERRRGISIELGFAELRVAGRSLSLIDVPGHERFVRTMIAGASGIDLFLMVIAVDDGVMPQTREHLTVLSALGVCSGVVAITKCDAVGKGRRARVARQAAALLPGHPVMEVSAHSGEGIAKLKDTLAMVAGSLRFAPERRDEAPILHVDRVFTVDGHGTVLTGTLRSGCIARGQRVVLWPSGREARVRAIESHGRRAELAVPHQRTALNLGGIAREQVSRGEVLTSRGSILRPSYRLDVRLERGGARQLRDGTRIQVHHGTRETPARVALLDDAGLAQLRLQRTLIAARGERVVLRQLAPPDTLGGAVVLDPSPPRRGRGKAQTDQVAPRAKRGEAHEKEGVSATESGPNPKRELGDTAERALALLRRDGTRPRRPQLLAAELGVDSDQVEGALGELGRAGHLVQIKPDIWFPGSSLAEIRRFAIELARTQGPLSVADLRDALGTSRKYAVALLEWLDAEKVLLRQGERHVLRRLRRSEEGNR